MTPSPRPLTASQLSLLNALRVYGAGFERGAAVRVAQALAKRGLVTVTDEGGSELGDGERWWVAITPEGRRTYV